ncbi:hypothetical protein HY384_00155 [Candidatus Daviesbacteria bacterium]|nr:hypothetical protein [Candidatus Daviesbacteria bacterium]
MEDGFKGKDLSDKDTRDKYTLLLAGIFEKATNSSLSRDQLIGVITWVEDPKRYQQAHKEAFGYDISNEEVPYNLAFTSDTGSIFLNLSAAYLQSNVISKNAGLLRINSLSSLREMLFHEWEHLFEPLKQDDLIFNVVDPNNRLKGKQVAGFNVMGYSTSGFLRDLFQGIKEATAELSSKKLNLSLFGSFYNYYPMIPYRGRIPVAKIVVNLEELLDAANISIEQMREMRRDSNLRGFLLLLTEQFELNSKVYSERERISYGLRLFVALARDEQPILQDYIERARSNRK